jgi:hypothetical protein
MIKTAPEFADELIAAEVAKQDGMWGEANERADASKGQMLHAAQAQLELVNSKEYESMGDQSALEFAKSRHYPKDWDGFRDYGSGIANLAVAAAYLRNEIKRRLRNGEGYYRAPRTQPYNPEIANPKTVS